MMSDRLTKQGVRDLNPKGYNGRGNKHSDPVECQHNFSEGRQIDVEYVDVGGVVDAERPIFGRLCLWCGEKRRT